ncbi:MAG: SUMF1/EgtB/PvdO family nonheme iron enzyme [Alphaproteobacteria bacterium]|nr:SUMF1/EgtB/PvdO family nonheme iron enzyme [Alphaproteobacteria bacterium]
MTDPLSLIDALISRYGLSDEDRAALESILEITRPPTGADSDTFDALTSQELLSESVGDSPTAALARAADDTRAPFERRFRDLGLIGKGGMGEVRRVEDLALRRTLALKTLQPRLAGSAHAVTRFVEEAQITAQLEHPGIVPVHELGTMPDRRLYYTMKEVRGRPLRHHIKAVHRASTEGWAPSPDGWTLRRLIDALRRASEAVAYAHSRGVLHRDLKPDNILVGDFGEVLVVDWGLAKVTGHAEEQVHTARTESPLFETHFGAVRGSPPYMPPEQAFGQNDRITERSDVYALGCVLFHILTGRPPHAREVGPTWTPAPLEGRCPIPDDLADICHRAMAHRPEERYGDASGLADDLRSWLDGAFRREQALKLVGQAESLRPRIKALRLHADTLRDEAAAALEKTRPQDPVDLKRPGWQKQDEAARMDREAEQAELLYIRTMHNALNRDPGLPEAEAGLAGYYRGKHAAAEAAGDAREAGRYEALVRAHDNTGRFSSYLSGDGALTLLTDPPEAEVRILRYGPQDRRLVAEPFREARRTPLVGEPLPMGRYLCELRAPDRATVRYPVFIRRNEHWDGAPPGQTEPSAVPLPPADALGPDDGYVAPGWFECGGDPEVLTGLPGRRVWLDGFVIRRFPVTNVEYLAFLDDLVARGREAEALAWAPRERGGTHGQQGRLIYGRRDDGGFYLAADADGDRWDPQWPVCMVSWQCATAYAAWLAETTGQPWRLPGELEWEKAARGVDGRCFPWGDFIDPTWACTRDSHDGHPLPVPVDRFPLDESPYGVRGMAGNMRDWCADVFHKDGPWHNTAEGSYGIAGRVFRGGCWDYPPQNTRSAFRYTSVESWRHVNVGFRVARSL